MSLPGGPDGALPDPPRKWVSDPAQAPLYQRTLRELEHRWAPWTTRWQVVCLLRILRLRLEPDHGIPEDELKANTALLDDPGLSVWRVGHLSEVAVQTGIRRVKANPLHLDVDWFGYLLPDWWATDVEKGLAEIETVRDLQSFLERSMGLEPSELNPDSGRGWSWPDGVVAPAMWGNLGKVPAPAGANEFAFEWWEGHGDGATWSDIELADGRRRFAFKTPVAIGEDYAD